MSTDKSSLIQSKFPWFSLSLIALWLLALGLRFWGLSRFNTLVFDEVYFAKFAHHYLAQTEFFDAHPPLGKYLIALGMWIGDRLPVNNPEIMNTLTGTLRSTFSYRWLNALVGSFIPLVVAGLAYQLNPRRSYALIAAGLMTLEGLFLVESRYALVNIYLVLFGLLGHGFGLLGFRKDKYQQVLWFSLSGIAFGLSASVKWNGLGFWMGFLFLLGVLKLQKKLSKKEIKLKKFLWYIHGSKIKLWKIITYWLILPFLTYAIVWIPHLHWNPDYNFWEMQQEILNYHQRIGSSSEVHTYCSSWLSWPLLIRPIAYYYKTINEGQIIFDVHAFGNPILWWGATLAIATITIFIFQHHKTPLISRISLYLIINYGANWLPWSQVKRCAFLYHYMGALVFSILALSLFLDRWINSSHSHYRILGISSLILMAIAFIFWLPIYLGIPLSPLGFRLRMWFTSWI